MGELCGHLTVQYRYVYAVLSGRDIYIGRSCCGEYPIDIGLQISGALQVDRCGVCLDREKFDDHLGDPLYRVDVYGSRCPVAHMPSGPDDLDQCVYDQEHLDLGCGRGGRKCA